MKQEKIIDKILCYMKNEIEKSGNKINMVYFDFSFLEMIAYGEELMNIKKILKNIPDEKIKKALRFALSNNYIKYYGYEKEFKYIVITEEGFARATSVENYHPISDYFKKLFLDNIIPTLINVLISAIVAYITTYLTIKGGK